MMRKLTGQEFYAVRRALLAGMRHTEIARELNLSVWTIARIDDEQRYEIDPVSEDQLPVDDAPPDYLAKDLQRCGGCGAMVYHWPCLACEMATMTPGAIEPEEDDESEEERPEVELAPCGRRRRRKRTNVAYRAKLARKGEVRS